jgi:phage-related holin
MIFALIIFVGIAKKAVIFLLVGIARFADAHLPGNGGSLKMAVLRFYLSNEGLSPPEKYSPLGCPYLISSKM